MSLCCFKEPICAFILGGISFIFFKIIYYFFKYDKIFEALKNKQIVITGGSSGIGLSLAKIAYQHGGHVTIVGRSLEKLKAANTDICAQKSSLCGSVQILTADICSGFDSLKLSFQKIIEHTDILVNCAGGAISRTFTDMTPSDIEAQITLNYTGSAIVTKLFLPSMLAKKSDSHIVFVSSMAGQLGLFGLAAYSASKYALRGLAESLQMEVSHRGVSVTVAFPPDTRTPGYDAEQIGKPDTTKKISEAAGLIEPKVVAMSIWRSVLAKQFYSSVGLDGWFLTMVTYGMCVPGSVTEALALVVLAPLIRIVAIGYGLWMRHVVRVTDQ